ncbi:MAG: PIN domain-containing protein [Chloroflexi bacterium]|nr:PIN domain-containing protein [Chloroflexota bacterium]
MSSTTVDGSYRVALDTNLLVYAEGVNGAAKRDSAIALIERLPRGSVVIPVQVLGELMRVLTGKAGRGIAEARGMLLEWRDAFALAPTTERVFWTALDLAVDHQFRIWDGVIFGAAVEAGCRLLLTEDLQDGFTAHGTTVANPFASTLHPLLAAILT